MQLTVKQAASFLDVTVDQVHAWVDEGAIPSSRAPGGIRFNEAELLEWATARGLRASHQQPGESATDPVRLADALARGGVHHGLRAGDREEALREAVLRLPLGPGADPETLVEVLLAREATGTTAVGDGVAIPHVRSPVVFNGLPPAIVLCTLERAVDFQAADRKHIHTLFLLASPTVNAHLKVLARLAAALHDAEFRGAVLSRRPADELLAIARRIDSSPRPGR